jgi:MoxR-like ATPase
MTNIDIGTTSRLSREVLDEVNRAVVGKREPLTLVLCGVLAGGHVLLEDLPGLGKTLAARSFAQTLGLRFTRAQFTPDLLPADLTGSLVFDQRVQEFCSGVGRSSPGCSSPTRSIERPRRRRPRSSRRCRSVKSPSKARRSPSTRRST